MKKRGALDIAGRVLQDIRRVFTYAVRRDLLKFNPALDLTGVVKLKKTPTPTSMQNEELGQFMSELEQYGKRGYLLTQYALQLLIYTFY